jgi:ABC-type glycerol-3-phosphate transport system substrate-binding protein
MRRVKQIVKIAVGGLLLLPALGLIAFGPRTSRHVPPGRVVVTYWEKWTDFEGEAMKRLCKLFNDTAGTEQGIYVDYIVTTQVDLKTLVATSGGDAPDLAGLWPQNISSFAAKNALQPLDARATKAGIDGTKIIPVYYNQCRYHDQLYAVPLTPWSLALYYNKGLLGQFREELARAGYGADRPPRTLDELLGYCKVLQRRDARGDYEMMGFLPSVPEMVGWYWNTWGLWAGGTFTDPQTHLARVDTPEFIRGYEWVHDFLRMFGQREVLRFEASLANFNSPDNPFMKGKLVMAQQGPWFANMIREYGPDIEYGVAPFPTADGSEISYCGQDVLVIPNGAHHPEQAWAFIEWLYTSAPVVVPSGQSEPTFGYEYCLVNTPQGRERRAMPPLRPIEWICWNHYKNGPLIDPSPAFLETHPNPGIAIHERLARSPLARADPPLPNWFAILDEFMAAYRDIWAGTADVRGRLQACQQRIDALVEIATREQERYGDRYP